ncbi:MAG: dihydroorotase [Candidatus Omnitrophota bacterium]
MSLLIKNTRIVNADGVSEAGDILIEQGIIKKIAKNISSHADTVIDAKGKLVFPGLIDLHVHLREPGFEEKETIETGSRAAVKGGFTTICCMPNTNPPLDNGKIVKAVRQEAVRVGLLNVIPVGAITKGQKGQEMVDMFEMREAGCLALSDDGKSVENSQIMLQAMKYAQMVGLLLMEHCQDSALSGKGVMNEGLMATLLGMRGDPSPAESVIVSRDIELAKYLKTRVHFSHISLKRSCELIRAARAQGIAVTAECAPHHFSLTDEAVRSFDPNTKVNPPLRTKEDIEALKEALADGTLDCIATDHAPHSQEDKELGFDAAPSGISGLETALGLAMTQLVQTKILTLAQLADKMSASPARILGLDKKGRVAEGFDADLTIIDPEEQWEVRKKDFASKGKNSPFFGWSLQGRVSTTICGGKVVFEK